MKRSEVLEIIENVLLENLDFVPLEISERILKAIEESQCLIPTCNRRGKFEYDSEETENE